MLDYIILIALIFPIGFALLGYTRKSGALYTVSALFFTLIGIGIFATGWQSYYLGTTVTMDETSVTTHPQNLAPNLNGTQEQQIIWGISMLFIIVGFFAISAAAIERKKNIAAKSLD